MEADAALGGDFFSRPAVSQILEKRLEAFRADYRQNVGLIGRKFLGKSSVLKNFLQAADVNGIIPVYIEIGREPFESFVYKWMGALLYGIMKTRKEEAPLGRLHMIRKARAVCPKTLAAMRRVRALVSDGDHEKALREIFHLTQEASEELKRKVVLVIDEFHRLQHFSFKHIFSTLGREIMIQKDTMYIVASSAPETAQHIFKEELSLLFGNFETVEMQPLAFSEGHDFIHQRLGSTDLRRSLERFLLRITDGNPYYLNVILDRMKLIGKDRWLWRMNENVVAEALTEELFYRSGLLHLRFSSVLEMYHRPRTLPHIQLVLMALALGHKKMRAITHFTKRGLAETKKALLRLTDDGLITRAGAFYVLSDTLFSFWLRETHRRQEEYLGWDRTEASDLFRRRMHILIQECDESDRKEVSARIVELFRHFQDEIIVLGGKRTRFPKFEEIKCRPSNGRVFPVYAKASQDQWMAQVVHETLTEEDVRRFLSDEQSLPKRAHERIMITVKGADLNAKLLAKAHDLTIWNLRQLNQLFKLYGHPKVIM